eukprot:TRINITY_DN57015_c0_g1_i2.p1 TRINITY_DN57015_c0_g1~~TRINITY_DN57015_c0_g1_i2.p1  ORF type:complete len:115 (+),score=17.91 TRINITY_DN57015_c0_g1_i2:25-369(+)
MLVIMCNGLMLWVFFFFQAEDGIRDAQESRGLGDVYKRQIASRMCCKSGQTNTRVSGTALSSLSGKKEPEHCFGEQLLHSEGAPPVLPSPCRSTPGVLRDYVLLVGPDCLSTRS